MKLVDKKTTSLTEANLEKAESIECIWNYWKSRKYINRSLFEKLRFL